MSAELKTYALTNQIFVCVGQAITGPMALDDAKVWAESNAHREDAFVWCEGFPSWMRVTNFAELRPTPKPPPFSGFTMPVPAQATSHTQAAAPVQAKSIPEYITDEPTLSNFTNFSSAGFSQPWTYPVAETTQPGRPNPLTQAQPESRQTQMPAQTHVLSQAQHQVHTQPQPQARVQNPIQTNVNHRSPLNTNLTHNAPVHPIPTHQATPVSPTYTPARPAVSPKLPERRKIPAAVENIKIDPVVLKNSARRAAQILGVFVILGTAYYGATRIPMKEFTTYVQNLTKKSTPVPAAAPTRETKVAETKTTPTAAQPQKQAEQKPYDAAAIQRTISRPLTVPPSLEVFNVTSVRLHLTENSGKKTFLLELNMDN
jgi:hypothetical protein